MSYQTVGDPTSPYVYRFQSHIDVLKPDGTNAGFGDNTGDAGPGVASGLGAMAFAINASKAGVYTAKASVTALRQKPQAASSAADCTASRFMAQASWTFTVVSSSSG